MTIHSQELHTVYSAARESKIGVNYYIAARIADAAYGAACEEASLYDVKLASDDRAENMICEAFRFACVSMDLDWYKMIDAAYEAELGETA